MTSLQELEKLTIQWFKDRQIIPNSTQQAQCVKLYEEFTEILDAYNKHNRDLMLDAIGDVTVVLIGLNKIRNNRNIFCNKTVEALELITNSTMPRALIHLSSSIQEEFAKSIQGYSPTYKSIISELQSLALHYNSSLRECLELAYTVISKRTGYLSKEGIFIKNS